MLVMLLLFSDPSVQIPCLASKGMNGKGKRFVLWMDGLDRASCSESKHVTFTYITVRTRL